jgi:hypothetical protein
MRKRLALFFFLVFTGDIALDVFCMDCCPDEAAQQACAVCAHSALGVDPARPAAQKAPDVKVPHVARIEPPAADLLLDKSLFRPPAA